jgi:hypothetical protein
MCLILCSDCEATLKFGLKPLNFLGSSRRGFVPYPPTSSPEVVLSNYPAKLDRPGVVSGFAVFLP